MKGDENVTLTEFSKKFISKFIPSIQHMLKGSEICSGNCSVNVVTMQWTSCQSVE